MLDRLEGSLYRFYGFRVNGKKWLFIMLLVAVPLLYAVVMACLK